MGMVPGKVTFHCILNDVVANAYIAEQQGCVLCGGIYEVELRGALRSSEHVGDRQSGMFDVIGVQ